MRLTIQVIAVEMVIKKCLTDSKPSAFLEKIYFIHEIDTRSAQNITFPCTCLLTLITK